MLSIRRILSAEEPIKSGLCTLLIDAVDGGASVGFLAPLSRDTAITYWEEVFFSLGSGLVLWVAESGNQVVGSVQLNLCCRENGRHRADVQKLFVLRTHRDQGISSELMKAVEAFAGANGRSLLVLDTIAGSKAEAVYRHFRWKKVGEIPEYAAMPDGELRATAYYFKRILNVNRQVTRTSQLLIFLVLYGAASLFHYAHNAEFLGDYPNMPAWLSPSLVYGAWLGVTAVGLVGYLLLRRGYQLAGPGILGVYGTLGLDGLAHYTLAPLPAHTFAMNLSIWLEAITGLLLLATVADLMLRRLRQGA